MGDRGQKRNIAGVVVSDKMNKTIVVRAERLVKHSVFHKYVKKYVRYKVHDEENICNTGDKVLIVESRPLSRDKRWRLSKIMEKAV
ncbi:MAG: 30S ribosomal protein S17 [Syntrophales bacterium]